uniref:Lysophospholipase-like protein, putative n=1 Tax=Theileria annulata TaxID=5874 RepID=A0A3B0MUT7_THEAN
MVGEHLNLALDGINLDLNKINFWKENVYNLVNLNYAPKPGYQFVKITNSKAVLWETDGSTFCRKVTVSQHNNSFIFLYINITNKVDSKSLYFVNSQWHSTIGDSSPNVAQSTLKKQRQGNINQPKDDWCRVKSTDFFEKLNKVVELHQFFSEVELNLGSKLNHRQFFINNSHKLLIDVYLPKLGYKLTKVKSGLFEIWSSNSPNEKCITAFAYPRTRYSYLHLVIETGSPSSPSSLTGTNTNTAGRRKNLYYKRSIYRWNEVSKEEFFSHFEMDFGKTGVNGEVCNLDRDLYCYYYKNIPLKIDNIDEDLFFVTKTYCEKVTNLSINPKPGFFLKEIYLDRFILKCSKIENVLLVNLHMYNEELVTFYIVLSTFNFKSKFPRPLQSPEVSSTNNLNGLTNSHSPYLVKDTTNLNSTIQTQTQITPESVNTILYFKKRDSTWALVSYSDYMSTFTSFSYYKPSFDFTNSINSTRSSSRSNSIGISRRPNFMHKNRFSRVVHMRNLLRKNLNIQDEVFQGKIFSNTFKNHKNLNIRTYFSPSENYICPKKVSRFYEFASEKNVILVHGMASSFMDQFMAINFTKALQKYNYLNLNPYFMATIGPISSNFIHKRTMLNGVMSHNEILYGYRKRQSVNINTIRKNPLHRLKFHKLINLKRYKYYFNTAITRRRPHLIRYNTYNTKTYYRNPSNARIGYTNNVSEYRSFVYPSYKRNLAVSNSKKYFDVFNPSNQYMENILDVFKSCSYTGSLVELLNKLGYNVYALDLQSHGLSESATKVKCHVTDYQDYVLDLIQFIEIVKTGKFFDNSDSCDLQYPTNSLNMQFSQDLNQYSSEEQENNTDYFSSMNNSPISNESSNTLKNYINSPTSKEKQKEQYVLIAHSMGANISLQAIKQYNSSQSTVSGEINQCCTCAKQASGRSTDSNENLLVDVFISVSGMYNVLDILTKTVKKIFPIFFKFSSMFAPALNNVPLKFRDYTTTFRLYKRFHVCFT